MWKVFFLQNESLELKLKNEQQQKEALQRKLSEVENELKMATAQNQPAEVALY